MPPLPFTEPRTWTENLIAAVLADVFDDTPYEGTPVLLGLSQDQRTFPSVVAYCSAANVPPEFPDWFRNYNLQATVLIGSQADDNTASPESPQPVSGEAAHKALVALVLARLADLSAYQAAAAETGSAVYDVTVSGVLEDREDRRFGSAVSLEIKAALDLPGD